MSVLFETSLGDIVIDLEVESCPRTCENFLKLCKVYYYNLNAFFNGTIPLMLPEEMLIAVCSIKGLPGANRRPNSHRHGW
jgi:hypothetical protein